MTSTALSVQRTTYLWGPQLDIWLLGGASVLAFIAFRAANLSGHALVNLAFIMMVLAHLVNHPHFAHSYQIFYAGFGAAVRGELSSDLRLKWWGAAVVAPLALVAYLGFAAIRALDGDLLWVGVSINLMGALVGWHYVKQGFGMAMTDAALKRSYWPNRTRQLLLINAYACWLAAWIGFNSTKHAANFWGYFSIEFTLPAFLVWFAWTLFGITTLVTATAVVRTLSEMKSRKTFSQLPLGGILAYFVSLYLWTAFSWAEPAYLLVIPFFHSLQYLTVVWRLKINEVSERSHRGDAKGTLARFLIAGVALGGLGFWIGPGLADFAQTGQWPSHASVPALAMASAWIFINVHHYIIDSVIWRKGNPLVARHLFGVRT